MKPISHHTLPKNVSIPKVSAPSRQPRRLLRYFCWGFTFAVTTIVSAAVGATLALVAPLSEALQSQEPKSNPTNSLVELWQNGFQYYVARPVNILVLGIDRVPDAPPDSPSAIFAGRSDTILLLNVNPMHHTVSLLSIPRDTLVDLSQSQFRTEELEDTGVPDYGVMKANHANVLGGPALAAQVVSQTLNGVTVDRYIRINTEAFRELVDLLGGLDVFVPYPMQYTDYTQNLKIDLQPGWQTLNGDQAEQFARFRHDAYGDIGRVQRQQVLLKALRQRITNPSVLPQIPKILRMMSKYIDTNLSLEELLALGNFGLKLDSQHVRMVMLPGRFSQPHEYAASFWIMDPTGRDRVMAQYFAVNHSASTTSEDALESESLPITELRIAIQNASGQPHQAQRVADYLADQGFHRVYVVQDWPDQSRQTNIIVQQGDLAAASHLKQVLGFGEIEANSTGDLESDITIRVGSDLAQ